MFEEENDKAEASQDNDKDDQSGTIERQKTKEEIGANNPLEESKKSHSKSDTNILLKKSKSNSESEKSIVSVHV